MWYWAARSGVGIAGRPSLDVVGKLAGQLQPPLGCCRGQVCALRERGIGLDRLAAVVFPDQRIATDGSQAVDLVVAGVGVAVADDQRERVADSAGVGEGVDRLIGELLLIEP